MYTNVAYLGEQDEDIVDLCSPLLVTAVGHYRFHTAALIETNRPNGRGDYQLLYVNEGKLHAYIDGKERLIKKGGLLLFRPHEAQVYKYYAAEKPETFWIHFTGCDVPNLLARAEIPEKGNVFSLESASDVQWLFMHMIKELRFRRKNYDEILKTDLLQLFLLLNRSLEENTSLDSDALNEIELAIYYFNENYNTNISIKEYASKRHISACWFNRIFKQATNVTPMQYIIDLRILNATNLLGSTNHTVSQIAAIVGYDDAYYFSRLFKNHVGNSPTEYRKTVRG